MKIDKKIKAAYEALPTPKAEDVLPTAAFREEKRERRLFRPVIYAVATICLCTVIGVAFMMNKSHGNVPVIEETGVGGDDIEILTQSDSVRVSFDLPWWIDTPDYYLIVEITGLFREDTVEEYNENTGETLALERKFYSFEYIYAAEDSIYDNYDLLVFERIINGGTDNKIEVEKGDVLLVLWRNSLNFKGAWCLCIRVNEFDDPGYMKFENGTTEITEDGLSKLTLSYIEEINDRIDYRNERGIMNECGKPEYGDSTPSFPTNRLIGTVTKEELIDFFKAIEKSIDEWYDWARTLRNVRF